MLKAARVATLALSFVLTGSAVQADQTCPECRRAVDDAFQFCPYDGTTLTPPTCAGCGKVMEAGWSFCPFDGHKIERLKAHKPASPTRPDDGTATIPPADDAATEAEPPPAPAPPVEWTGVGARDPLEAVDRLFQAIERNNETEVRSLYAWREFFAGVTDPAELDGEIERYLKRLMTRIPRTLKDRERLTLSLKIDKDQAWAKVGLKDKGAAAMAQEYEFSLRKGESGWRIVGIRP